MKSGSARAENNRGEDLAEWKNCATFVPGKMAEWSIAAVLKTVELQGSGGSNPSLSAKVRRIKQQNPANVTFAGFCAFSPQALESNVTQVGSGLSGVPDF